MALNPTTLIRSKLIFSNTSYPQISPRVGGLPAPSAKAVYPLDDPNTVLSALNHATKTPVTPVTGTGGALYTMAGGGLAIAGRGGVNQEPASALDMSKPWTVFAGVLLQETGSASVWTVLEDQSYFTNLPHGFFVYAQSGGALANGALCPLFVRWTKDGAENTTTQQFQMPTHGRWQIGRGFLFALSHDGAGTIKAQIQSANGKVSEVVRTIPVADLTGPAGAKTNTTLWRAGGTQFPSPGTLLEGWGALQAQWSDADAFAAYRRMRALANANGRNWT